MRTTRKHDEQAGIFWCIRLPGAFSSVSSASPGDLQHEIQTSFLPESERTTLSTRPNIFSIVLHPHTHTHLRVSWIWYLDLHYTGSPKISLATGIELLLSLSSWKTRCFLQSETIAISKATICASLCVDIRILREMELNLIVDYKCLILRSHSRCLKSTISFIQFSYNKVCS